MNNSQVAPPKKSKKKKNIKRVNTLSTDEHIIT